MFNRWWLRLPTEILLKGMQQEHNFNFIVNGWVRLTTRCGWPSPLLPGLPKQHLITLRLLWNSNFPCNVRAWLWNPSNHGRPQWGAKRTFAPWKLELRSINIWKTWISSWILNNWVNSCNDNLFADMTLTLHKSQVHCFGNMQLWALQFTKSASLPAEAGCDIWERIVLLLAFVA